MRCNLFSKAGETILFVLKKKMFPLQTNSSSTSIDQDPVSARRVSTTIASSAHSSRRNRLTLRVWHILGDSNSSAGCFEHLHLLQRRFPETSSELCNNRITKSVLGLSLEFGDFGVAELFLLNKKCVTGTIR